MVWEGNTALSCKQKWLLRAIVLLPENPKGEIKEEMKAGGKLKKEEQKWKQEGCKNFSILRNLTAEQNVWAGKIKDTWRPARTRNSHDMGALFFQRHK